MGIAAVAKALHPLQRPPAEPGWNRGELLDLLGEVLTPDGKHRWRRRGQVALGNTATDAAAALGAKLGTEIRAEAGPLYTAHFGDNGW